MEIAQFKYSIAVQDNALRMADARKTLTKFAVAEADFTAQHGMAAVSTKVTYSLNTNRPISDGMLEALCAASQGGAPGSADGKAQLDQLRSGSSPDFISGFGAELPLLPGINERLRSP
jgi:hypothetical protein